MDFSKTEAAASTIVPCVSGLLSLLASGAIIFKIMRSEEKLSSPYSRIAFGMSLGDIFASSAHFTSTFLNPSSASPKLWGAFGTQATCSIQGFIAMLGSVSAPTYNLALCVYYLCVIKYNMRDSQFVKKVEPFFHGFAIIWSLSTALITLATKSINQGIGGSCHINPYPRGCDKDGPIECERGKMAEEMRWLFLAIPVLLLFIAINVVMATLWYSVRRQEIVMESYSFRLSLERRMEQDEARRGCWPFFFNRQSSQSGTNDHGPIQQQNFHQTATTVGSSGSSNLNTNTGITNNDLSNSNTTRRSSSIRFSNTLTTRASPNVNGGSRQSQSNGRLISRRNSSSRRRYRTREILRQAVLYFFAFLLTYGFIFLAEIVEGIYGTDNVPFFFYILNDIFLPLQGFFNIIVFMRPHISKFRRRNPGYSYFKAFFMCLKNIDLTRADTQGSVPSSRRRPSSRHMATVGRLSSSGQDTQRRDNPLRNVFNRFKPSGANQGGNNNYNLVGRRASNSDVNVEVGRRSSMGGMDEKDLLQDDLSIEKVEEILSPGQS